MKLYPVLLLSLLGPVVRAEILYDLAPFDRDTAFASDAVAGQFNNQRLAEQFVLSNPLSELAEFRWWGRSEGAFFPDLRNMESFTLSVYADAGGLPGAELLSTTFSVPSANPTQVDVDFAGRPIFELRHALASPLTLGPGGYWLSVGTDNIDPEGDGFYWNASQLAVSGDFARQSPVGSAWEQSGFADLAFQVHGTVVPEPGTLAVVLTALALLDRRRSRR